MRERLTFANAMSCVALFVALGGTAVALKANSVGSRAVKDESLRSKDIRNGSLNGADLRADSVGPRELAGPTNNFPSVRLGSDAGTCNPMSESFVPCATVVLPISEPSQVLLTATGGQHGPGGSGSCRFQADSQAPLNGTEPVVGDTASRSGIQPNGFALTAVAGSPKRIPPGNRTFRLLCNEETGDVQFSSTTLSVVALGDGLE